MQAMRDLSFPEFKMLWQKLLAEQDALLATLAPPGDSEIESLIAEYDELSSELRRRDKASSLAPNAAEASPLRAGLRPRVDGTVPDKEGDGDRSPGREAIRSQMRGLIGEKKLKGMRTHGLIGGQLKKEQRQLRNGPHVVRKRPKPADKQQMRADERGRKQQARGPAAQRKPSKLEELYANRQGNVKSRQDVRAALGVGKFSGYSSEEDGAHSGSDTDGADAGATMSPPDVAGTGNQVKTSCLPCLPGAPGCHNHKGRTVPQALRRSTRSTTAVEGANLKKRKRTPTVYHCEKQVIMCGMPCLLTATISNVVWAPVWLQRRLRDCQNTRACMRACLPARVAKGLVQEAHGEAEAEGEGEDGAPARASAAAARAPARRHNGGRLRAAAAQRLKKEKEQKEMSAAPQKVR
jgi:hypothetical protein